MREKVTKDIIVDGEKYKVKIGIFNEYQYGMESYIFTLVVYKKFKKIGKYKRIYWNKEILLSACNEDNYIKIIKLLFNTYLDKIEKHKEKNDYIKTIKDSLKLFMEKDVNIEL